MKMKMTQMDCLLNATHCPVFFSFHLIYPWWLMLLSVEKGSCRPWTSNLSVPNIHWNFPARHIMCTATASVTAWLQFSLSGSLHVCSILKLFQCDHHLIHGWPALCLHGQALQCETRCSLRSRHRVLPLQSGIHDADDPSLACEIRLCPLNQIVFFGGPVLVDGTLTGQQFNKNNSKAINIALTSQMTCQK